MRRIFGADFEEYEQNVPVFIPRLSVWKNTGGKFDFQLYLKYREYRAWLGSFCALVFLAAKAYLLNIL
jgi:protein-S-isoprenylcysteine O-methyltransferase Ste14